MFKSRCDTQKDNYVMKLYLVTFANNNVVSHSTIVHVNIM